jgi:hypothetical protein
VRTESREPIRSFSAPDHQPHNRQQQACANKGADYRANEASTEMDSYSRQQIAGDDRANDTDNDVSYQSKSAASDKVAS